MTWFLKNLFFIMMLEVNVTSFILYILFIVAQIFLTDVVAVHLSIALVIAFLIFSYDGLKKTKTITSSCISYDFLRQLFFCIFFISLSAFILILELQKIDIGFLVEIKLYIYIIAAIMLVIIYINLQEVLRYGEIKKLIDDETFLKRMKEQKTNGYFILDKTEINDEFLQQLDFGIYTTLNKKTVLNMKYGEKEIFTITKDTLQIYDKLLSATSTTESKVI